MKLWKISQTVNTKYDTYDSAVVSAETEDAARIIHPGARDLHGGLATASDVAEIWTDPQNVTVEYLGEAKEGTEGGKVICASFNAG